MERARLFVMSQPSWAREMMVGAMVIALCTPCAACGAGFDVAGTGFDDEHADVEMDVGAIGNDAETPPSIETGADVASASDTSSALDTSPSAALDVMLDTTTTPDVPPDVVATEVTDSGFVSTPGFVDCAGVACDFSKSRYCCWKTSGPTCGAPGVSCSGASHFLCDEQADCIAYGTGGVCCSDTVGGGIGCLPGCPAPHVQFCMTDAECLVGKCVASSRGPGKAPHGECSRP